VELLEKGLDLEARRAVLLEVREELLVVHLRGHVLVVAFDQGAERAENLERFESLLGLAVVVEEPAGVACKLGTALAPELGPVLAEATDALLAAHAGQRLHHNALAHRAQQLLQLLLVRRAQRTRK